MKVLTLTQPWASLIALGFKAIETRSWSTTYRGPLAIHAGAGLGPVGGARGLMKLCLREPFATVLREAGYANPLRLPLGVIVAVCDLVDCRPTAIDVREYGAYTEAAVPVIWPITEHERAFGDYTPGRFAWLLDDRRRIDPPLPYRGSLGLRTVPRATAIDVMQRAA